MRSLFILTIFTLLQTFLFANDGSDQVLRARKTSFLNDFFKRTGFIYPTLGPANTFIHPKDPVYASKPQILLKNGKTVSISLAGSGRIYECTEEDDTSYVFKRIDHSPNQNYNIGAYYYYCKGKLYCYAGYGFWKSHGTLKIFNQQDKEWDLIPLNKEITPQLFPIGNSWYDKEDQKLYVPFQSIVNAGILGEENLKGVIDHSFMVLDMKNLRWKKAGEATELTIGLITNGSYSISTDLGLLFINGQDLYLIEYKNNLIRKSGNVSLNQTILRAHQRGFLYQHNGYIYFLNENNEKTDSTILLISDFNELPGTIWQKGRSTLLLTGGLISASIFLFFLLVKSKRDAPMDTNLPREGLIKKKIEFSDIEISLLKLLLEKSKNGSATTVNEVNYTLGIKDKKTGLQKKVRSDIFNSINEKYSYMIKKNEPLILTIRSEADKRFFEFRLSESAIELIKDYIHE